MKKLLSLALALIMCLALAACGGSQGTSASSGGSALAGTTAGSQSTTGSSDEQSAEPAAAAYTVGICQFVQHDALDAATRGFRDALTDALGDAVKFDEQNAQGDSETCPTIVTGFVANDYDLIMANATPALQAAVAATQTIPILGTSVTDYATALAMDIDASKGTGINVAGSSDGVPGQLYADLLLELIPDAKKVSILYCSAEPNSVIQADDFIASMPDGIACGVFTFADSNDIQAVVTAAIADCDALYIPTDNQSASNATIIRNVTEPAGIPVIAGEEGLCSGCGLATVSINYYDIGYFCGRQAVQILRDGADVSTMPIEYASDPVKEYNPSYAEAIGFAIPDGFTAIG